jgi:dTDP-glucose 4,6-dehydratase
VSPRALVTGGAGFLGSHVCERLLREGWEVTCLDSLLTGRRDNVADFAGGERFRFQASDVTEPLDVDGDVDAVLHMASPASPADYLRWPIETLRVGALGTLHALDLALRREATFLLASTSEAYGDPLVHPQPESYWGNVNPVGPRSVYDEAKRYAEAATMAYHRAHGLRIRIARIFNTYGPRMRRDDGRAVPTFIQQALGGEPLTVHGGGTQTRSLCYVDDLVEGLYRLLGSNLTGPVNIGNPSEITVYELASLIHDITGSTSDIVHVERPVDDPELRCPDISLAMTSLDWRPEVSLVEGLRRTIEWAKESWA